MADNNTNPGGINPDAGGNQDVINSDISNQKDTVAYETYRRVLGEKKKEQEKREALEKQIKEYEEKSLLEQNKFKEAYESTKKLLDDTNKRLVDIENQKTESLKFASFLESLNGKLDRKYWNLVDLSNIIIDPATGQVDANSINNVVASFKKTYPEVIQKPNQANLPNSAPQSNPEGQVITRSNWLKLPVADMKKWRPEQIIS
jgi:hypothetical protein